MRALVGCMCVSTYCDLFNNLNGSWLVVIQKAPLRLRTDLVLAKLLPSLNTASTQNTHTHNHKHHTTPQHTKHTHTTNHPSSP